MNTSSVYTICGGRCSCSGGGGGGNSSNSSNSCRVIAM